MSGIIGDAVPWARDGICPATRKLVDDALFLAVCRRQKKSGGSPTALSAVEET